MTKFTRTQELIRELRVRDVMRTKVVTVQGNSMMSGLRAVFRDSGISGVPVLHDKKLVGIVSLEDFIKWLADREDDMQVSEKMTPGIKFLYDDEPLIHALAYFDQYGFGRFPVIWRNSEELAGIVTKTCIIEGLLKKLEIDYHDEENRRYDLNNFFSEIRADDVSFSYKYHVPGKNFDLAGEVASNFKKALKKLGVHPDIIRRSVIATYEAAMNLVVFTNGGFIKADISPSTIHIHIEDDGPGISDISKAMMPGYSTAPPWVRELGFGAGLGLCNIKKCADNFKIRSCLSKGTELEIRIDMSSPSVTAA